MSNTTQKGLKTGLMQYVQLYRMFFRPHWRAALVVSVFNVGSGLVKALEPLAFAPAIQLFTKETVAPAASLSGLNLNNLAPSIVHWFNLESTGMVGTLIFSSTAYLGLAILSSLLGLAGFMLMLRGRTMIQRDMLLALHRHLLTLPFGYFGDKSSGDFVSRLSNDVSQTAQTLDAVTRGVLQSIAEALFYGYLLFRTDGQLSFGILLLGCLHFAITRMFSFRAKVRTKAEFVRRGVINHHMLETLSGLRVIKSFSGERYDVHRMAEAAEKMRQAIVKARSVMYLEVPTRYIANALISCLALGMAFCSMTNGNLVGGGFVLFMAVAMRALGPVAILSQQILLMSAMLGGAERVLEVFEARDTLQDGTTKPKSLSHAIVFRNVGFQYRPDTPVLKDINLTLRRGETVAVVGPSGGGKTTMMDLLLRLYDPTAGEILYDGESIRTFSQRAYRRHFGVVPQDPFLFHTTIRENVVFGRTLNEEMLEYSLKVANAWEFSQALPDKLETVCGARGALLSGGQRQRIALARAVYGRPEILLLDEATSSLDSESERAIQEALLRVTQDRTALIIAHRLSTIMNADRIVVMNSGRIEAEGRHDALIQASPTYRLLYSLQYERPQSARKLPPAPAKLSSEDDDLGAPTSDRVV